MASRMTRLKRQKAVLHLNVLAVGEENLEDALDSGVDGEFLKTGQEEVELRQHLLKKKMATNI